MHQRVIDVLANLTGSLAPMPATSEHQLESLRLMLAEQLLRNPADLHHYASTLNQLFDSTSAAIRPTPSPELQQIAARAEQKVAASPGQALEFRIIPRSVAIADISFGSIPEWAVGARVHETFGPFLTNDERPVWFDVYRLAPFMPVVRMPGGAPFLFISIGTEELPVQRYSLARGSVWIAAQALTSSAPSGTFSALRISGGMIHVSERVNISAGAIQVPAGATVTLVVQPEPSDHTTQGTNLGAVARDSTADFPREVTLVFSPTRCAIDFSSQAQMHVYGSTFRLCRNQAPAAYDPAINRVLVPLDVDARKLAISDAHSALCTVQSEAPLEQAAWALPVAPVQDTSGLLPHAAGAGGLALVAQPGLRAEWRGLTGGAIALGRSFVIFDSTKLSVIALTTTGRKTASQTFDLWRDSAKHTRLCSLELKYQRAAPLIFTSSATGQEVLAYTGLAIGHLDRPVPADGKRMSIRANTATVLLSETAATGSTVLVFASAELLTNTLAHTPQPKPLAFALANALLKTTPPLALMLHGYLQNQRTVHKGFLQLYSRVLYLLPTLPDPYVSNALNPRESPASVSGAVLLANVRWPHPDSITLALHLGAAIDQEKLQAAIAPTLPLDAGFTHATHPASNADGERIVREDAERLEQLRNQFDEVLGSVKESHFLLDVSGNADQLGVGIGFGRSVRDADAAVAGDEIAIDGVHLTTRACNVRVFTVPQIQWEPVWTIQNPLVGTFPSPLASASDGGPTLIGINTVNLVPIAPIPVVDELIRKFRSGVRGTHAAALFTLPFGMKAVAAPLRPPRDFFRPGSSVDLCQPEFPDLKLSGGRQISVCAIDPMAWLSGRSPALPGAAVQTRNGVDPATGLSLFKSVLADSAAAAVEQIFNDEFAPDGKRPKVPLTRIDFSGYGASTFSRWFNARAETAATSKVEFDVLVGRTAYEVVQVRSILYPWGVRVVRTITLQRNGSGGVFRRDSGWVAVTDGMFDFPEHSSGQRIKTHPGVVKGVVNVRRIRDTSHTFERTYGTGPNKVQVKLAAVRFDADAIIAGTTRGAVDGRVTSVDQFGFVQLAPSEDPLTPEQYDHLLVKEGPLGGPVDCQISVGESRQHMRVTRIEVASARSAGGTFDEFAAAARGALRLPQGGQWSVVQQPVDITKECVPVARQDGVPLVRKGPVGVGDSANANPYLFAEPADLLSPTGATSNYGLLWSTGTQRLLLVRPKIESGASAITSDVRPVFADPFALVSAPGVFPAAKHCLEVPFAGGSLEVPTAGQMHLVLPSVPFAALPIGGGAMRELANAGTTRVYVDYTNARISLSLDSRSANPWAFSETGIAIVHESDGICVKTTGARIEADALRSSQFTLETEEFGERLDNAKGLMPMFSSSSLGGNISSGGDTVPLDSSHEPEGPNPKIGLKFKKEIEVPEGMPLLIGLVTKGEIEIGSDFRNYFSLEILLALAVSAIIPAAAYFKYEAQLLKRPAAPGSSNMIKAGSKEELILAIGLAWDHWFMWSMLRFNWGVFVGIGFTHDAKLGQKAIGVGAVFKAEGSVQYPCSCSLVEAGFTVEGQGIFEFSGGDVFLVARGTLAFELTLAIVINIEYEIFDAEIARQKL